MLVLSRKVGDRVVIGGEIEVTVIEIRNGHAKLAFNAPPHIPIHREEVYRRIQAAMATEGRTAAAY